MMKLTVDPSPGYATKEVFYTYNANTNSLYAIFPKYPSNRKLVLKNLPATSALADVSFLSTNEKLKCTKEGNTMVISLPEYDPNKIKSPYAYTVRIKNYGAFVRKPKIEISYQPDMSGATIDISTNAPAVKIIYTISNTEGKKMVPYSQPFLVKGDAVIKAFGAKNGNYLPSDTAEMKVTGLSLLKAYTSPFMPVNGLKYSYYESDKMDMSVFKQSTPIKQGITDKVSVTIKQRTDKYGLVFEGYIRIDKTGGYAFYTTSDDGSVLEIDGREIVNNDGNHGFEEKDGKCLLEKGFHKIRLCYFDSGGGNNLLFSYHPLGQPKTEVPASVLYH